MYAYVVGFIFGALLMLLIYTVKGAKQAGETAQYSRLAANLQCQRDAALRAVKEEVEYRENLNEEQEYLRSMAEVNGIDPDDFDIIEELEAQRKDEDKGLDRY